MYSKKLSVNPFPTLLTSDVNRIFGTVASSPRAVTDRLLGCVGTVRIDTNYTKPPGALDPHLEAQNVLLTYTALHVVHAP